MKNVTVSLPDETYHRARVRAASVGRSLSSIVREHLASFGNEQTDFERREEMQRRLFEDMDAKGTGLKMSENISRDDLYNERFDR